jgi:conjugal transfer pilin signal peptidase TrbI
MIEKEQCRWLESVARGIRVVWGRLRLRFGKVGLIVWFVAIASFFWPHMPGFATNIVPFVFLNETHSLPSGLYVRADGELERGSFVAFDARKHGVAGDRASRWFLKRVGGFPGDVGSLSSNGVEIGGRVYKWFPEGRGLGHWKGGVVPDGSVFVYTDHPQSFDSRYYGPVPMDLAVKIRPLVVWGER